VDFIKSSGYTYALAGENLAKNFTDSGGVVNAWMASPTHRDNILKSGYRDVGFAIVNGVLNGEETTLVVQMFGSATVAQAPPPQVTAPPVQTPTSRPVAEAIASPPAPRTETQSVPEKEQPVSGVENEATPVAAVTEENTSFITPRMSPLFTGAFLGVSDHPLLNLTNITAVVAYGFIGILMVVFILDAYIVTRKRIVRVSGNNLTHLFFFTAFLFLIGFSSRGSIL